MIKTKQIAFGFGILISIFSADAQNPETSDTFPVKPLEIGASVPAVTAKNQEGSDLDFVFLSKGGYARLYEAGM